MLMLHGDSVLHSRPIGVHLNTVTGSCMVTPLQGKALSLPLCNCQQPHAAAALVVQMPAGSVTAEPASSIWDREVLGVSSVTCRARLSAVRTPSRLSGRCAAASCSAQPAVGFRVEVLRHAQASCGGHAVDA